MPFLIELGELKTNAFKLGLGGRWPEAANGWLYLSF
jgi:hypothetical protein